MENKNCIRKLINEEDREYTNFNDNLGNYLNLDQATKYIINNIKRKDIVLDDTYIVEFINKQNNKCYLVLQDKNDNDLSEPILEN